MRTPSTQVRRRGFRKPDVKKTISRWRITKSTIACVDHRWTLRV